MSLLNIQSVERPVSAGSVNYGVIQVQVVGVSGYAIVARDAAAISSPVVLSGSSPDTVYDAIVIRAGEPVVELQWAGNVWVGLPRDSSGLDQVVVYVNIVERCK